MPGLYSLPTTDFVWNWGSTNLEQRRGTADIQMQRRGSAVSLRADGADTRVEHDDAERLSRRSSRSSAARLDFIYAVSEAMNYLEYQRVLEWATLDCKKYEAPEKTAEEKATREEEAREKMLRELERRRERQQRDAE